MIKSNIQDIVKDLGLGKVVIIVDDEDRENEGDLVCAAELVTADIVNFMAKYGRGLICLTLTKEKCRELDLKQMTSSNESSNKTAFTVSIEAKDGITTGISAQDRATTILAAVHPEATADDISENIEGIRTIKDGSYPMNNADEFIIIQQALQGE